MQAVQAFAANGGLVLAFANGFQNPLRGRPASGRFDQESFASFRCEHVF